MKKLLIFSIIFVFSGEVLSQVNQEVYREADVVKSDKKIITSKVPYDVNQLRSQLQKGKATIKGKMYARKRHSETGKKLYVSIIGSLEKSAENTPVYLIPYNDYVKDYVNLKENAEKPKRKTFVELHEDVFNTRLEAVTNNEGSFTFPNVKPGKYYVFGKMNTLTLVKRKYYSNGNVATNAYGQVVAEGYSSYNDFKSHYDYVDNIVEVKEDGGTVFVNVTDIAKDQNEELKLIKK